MRKKYGPYVPSIVFQNFQKLCYSINVSSRFATESEKMLCKADPVKWEVDEIRGVWNVTPWTTFGSIMATQN